MSIQDLGAIGEFIGSIGVIVTLIYLAIQIRSNTSATKASASFEATHSWADFNEQLSFQSDEVLDVFVGVFSETYDMNNLSETQYLRLIFFLRAMFQKLEGQYYLFKHGLVEGDLWEQRSSICKGVIQLPHIASWWEGEKRNNVYTIEFVEAIEDAKSIDATQLNKRPQ